MQSSNRPTNQALLIEAAMREEKYFTVYNHFRPNLKVAPITPKFYSKYQALDGSLVKPQYVELLQRYQSQTPKNKYPLPATENQRYGWYLEPLLDNGNDFRLDYRTKMSPDIKLALEMKRMTDKMRSVIKADEKKPA